jgi:hypothetical protein
MVTPLGRGTRVITIGVFAALAYDVTSANLSSPQTFELNSGQRSATLNKWLNINVGEALVWGIGASLMDGSIDPLIGVSLGLASMYVKYKYAVASGQKSGQPDMENHQTGSYNLEQGGSWGSQ